jgi:hypothetical protein
VWPRGVVVGGPGADELAGLVEIEEQALVEKLVAHSAIEGLNVAVLLRSAWCEGPSDKARRNPSVGLANGKTHFGQRCRLLHDR